MNTHLHPLHMTSVQREDFERAAAEYSAAVAILEAARDCAQPELVTRDGETTPEREIIANLLRKRDEANTERARAWGKYVEAWRVAKAIIGAGGPCSR
jgi:uncharacterized protein YifE (UPF0438 family)